MDQDGTSGMNPTPVAAWFNPADCFTFVLDREIRAAGMPGGYCGFALELAQAPDLERLQGRLDELAGRFPQATAALETRGKRRAWVATGRTLPLEVHDCPEGGEQGLSLALVSRPAELESDPPLSVHWLTRTRGGTLLLRWAHPLLDARGIKLVLDFLDAEDTGRFRDGPSPLSQKLGDWSWWQKCRLTWKAKRHNGQCIALDSSLPTSVETGPQTLRLRLRRYDGEESERIGRLAAHYTGLAGKTLYTVGCFMRAMESAGPPVAKAGYCIPYAFNLRRQNVPFPVFGNQVGCLFAQAEREIVRDRETLFRHLLAQNRQAVAQQLDLAYLPLMWLGQWLSPARYARFLRKQRSGGELSSAWFSDIGEMRFGPKGVLGVAVTGMYHLTWMTLPPGLALLAGSLDGRLNLSFNYLHPAVDEAWLEQVLARMDTELLGTAV
jgi:hypothetical protein